MINGEKTVTFVNSSYRSDIGISRFSFERQKVW